jgi:hypothetical protein
MRKITKSFNYLLQVLMMFLIGAASGGFAAAAATLATGEQVGELPGAGHVVEGESSVTKNEQIQDAEWYQKQIDKRIVEMKFTGTPIDQILRHAGFNKSSSITVKYYAVGQRPLRVTIAEDFSAMNTKTPKAIQLEADNIVGEMDTLLALDKNGNFVPGYQPGTDEVDKYHPLQIRVHAISSETNLPLCYATNGKRTADGAPFLIPDLPAGTVLLRMGRAAAEKDVSTGSYYTLPEASEQYCQRFIMMVEQTIYDRMSENEVDWSFTRVERMAMEDMRIGMEATGLFGVKSKLAFNSQGNVYTCEGIWYRAGKDLELGHWEIKRDAKGEPIVDSDGYYVKEYVIEEDELVDLVQAINEDAGNASRNKFVFVDNMIYSALCKIRSHNRMRILTPADNYGKTGLDFSSFESMGTKLMFYRHDLFNAWGFKGRGFSLDAEYLDKWVFQNWSRETYDLHKLFVRNSNAVTMSEFSCWTLQFPNAHARLMVPEYVAEKPASGSSTEGQAATNEQAA